MTSYQHENQEEYAFRLSESVSWASTIAKRATRLSAVLLMGCLPMNAQTGSSSAAPKPSEQKTQQQWLDSFSHLPMSFEANRGQTDPQVAFVSRGSGYTLFLTKDEAVFALNRSEGAQRRTSTLRMHFEGTNPKARVSGHDELEGKSNYFIGNDPNQWHTTIPTFAKVENRGIYTGVDLVYYGNQAVGIRSPGGAGCRPWTDRIRFSH